ncbi:multidrug effflux MFS transporter [Kocuria sp. M4R2S49]|uniref:multidrug effflux MFS transporter n=1 Tax=Kocuria rhizosphaericola TaxID=3376284 RepID=UPI00379D7DC7
MFKQASRRTQGTWFAVSLALVTVLGPAGTDMYLASLPDIAVEFSATAAQTHMSLTMYLMAMGAGQLVFGPITDAYGRRRPLLTGIVLFLLASVASSLSADIEQLLAARLAQGLGAALVLVVALSVVRDVAEGDRAARLFALLMTIEGLAPVLAPTVGGFVDVHFGWRAVLLVLAGLSLVVLINSVFCLPETLTMERRIPLRPATVVAAYRRIAADRAFLLPALALSAVFFALFAYIAGAPFVYQGIYGLDAGSFGTVFGLTGLAVIVGAALSARLVSRHGAGRLALTGSLLLALGGAVALIAAAAGAGLAGVVAGMAISLVGVGLAEATLMALVMGSQHTALGATAALLGAFQLMISSIATPLAGAQAEAGPLPWLVFLLVSSLVSAGLVALATRGPAATVTELGGH